MRVGLVYTVVYIAGCVGIYRVVHCTLLVVLVYTMLQLCNFMLTWNTRLCWLLPPKRHDLLAMALNPTIDLVKLMGTDRAEAARDAMESEIRRRSARKQALFVGRYGLFVDDRRL